MTQADPMTPAERAEIAARAEAATPGPWTHLYYDCATYLQGPSGASLLRTEDGEACVETEDDGYFIARARTDIPRLLAEVERLAAENARLRDAERIAWAATTGMILDSPPATRIHRTPGEQYVVLVVHRANSMITFKVQGPVLTPEARAAIDAAKETP